VTTQDSPSSVSEPTGIINYARPSHPSVKRKDVHGNEVVIYYENELDADTPEFEFDIHHTVDYNQMLG
jgi:hypothetical protein